MTYTPGSDEPTYLLTGEIEHIQFQTVTAHNDTSPWGTGSFSIQYGYRQLYCASPTSDTSGSYQIARVSVDPVDLTNYKTLNIRWQGQKNLNADANRAGDAGFFRFGLADTKEIVYNQNHFIPGYYIAYPYNIGWELQNQVIDISDVIGEHYIRTEAMLSENDSGYTTIHIKEQLIWLE